MPGNFKKEDLRIKKTYKVLMNAMHTLLSRRNFERITVNDLCEEALISRVTFYAHFNDKYDLLSYWLTYTINGLVKENNERDEIDVMINQFIYENSKIVTNLVDNANNEVLELLHGFIYSFIEIAISKKSNGELNYNQILLSNFCAGGMVNLLKLQVKSKFAPETQTVNTYFFEMLESIIDWDSKQSKEYIPEG